MAQSTRRGPPRPDREVLTATVDLASLDTVVRARDGTAYVLLELRETLLADLQVWVEDVRLEFAVVDPALGTVEPRDGCVEAGPVPAPLVRAVLDRVGVGLLSPGDAR